MIKRKVQFLKTMKSPLPVIWTMHVGTSPINEYGKIANFKVTDIEFIEGDYLIDAGDPTYVIQSESGMIMLAPAWQSSEDELLSDDDFRFWVFLQADYSLYGQ